LSEIRPELEATLAARHELGAELEPQLVERFVEKLETEIDRRIDARLAAQRRPGRRGSVTPMVLGSLGIAIPLMGVAGGTAGAVGIAFVCLAIVLVNLFWAWSNRN
jgi:Flp pilus assembly protein TadB